MRFLFFVFSLVAGAGPLFAGLVPTELYPAPQDTTYISAEICAGDSIVINGAVYNAAHPYGVEVIPFGKVDGSDSIILVNVFILPPGEYFFTRTYCNNQTLIINNHAYGPFNPLGDEILPGAAANGCDSIIHVSLSFADAPEYYLQQTICRGDTVWVGNTPYHANFYLGAEVLDDASYLGCDSTVHISLTVLPVSVDTLSRTICQDQTITVNGTKYSLQYPEGEELLPNAAANGCDSIVVVRLTFYETPSSFLGPDQSLELGDTFCLNINLPFVPDALHWLTPLPCASPPCFDFCRQALQSQTFILQINAPVDCILTDTMTLTVARTRNLFIANVFQPGAAPPNDRFFVQTDQSVRQIRWLKVFDRWGEAVFAVAGRAELSWSDGWDGRWKGTFVPNGVYTYALQVEYWDGFTEIITGDVALIR